MKPSIQLCDFWSVFSETETADALVVTGSLEPFTRLDQVKTIRAIFTEQGGGPKGSWATSDWSEVKP